MEPAAFLVAQAWVVVAYVYFMARGHPASQLRLRTHLHAHARLLARWWRLRADASPPARCGVPFTCAQWTRSEFTNEDLQRRLRLAGRAAAKKAAAAAAAAAKR